MQPDLNKGQLVKWNDDRGFGFIKPSESDKEIFVHISAIKTTGRRPRVGDTIFYSLTTEEDGRIRASDALIQGVISRTSTWQKAKTAPGKQKNEPYGLGAVIVATCIVLGLAFVELGYFPSRAPKSALPDPVTSTDPGTEPEIDPNCVVKGNISISTGARLYHVPGMEDYEGTIITPEKGERWFCSEKEATAAGWRRAPR
jgi:cold shock CspA family protein